MTDRSCPVCGGSLEGRSRNAIYCCKECYNKAKAEMQRENRKHKRGICKFCGQPADGPRRRICRECREYRYNVEMYGKEQADKMRAEKKIRRSGYSEKYSLDELAVMAKKYHTSYGKIKAFLDVREREPKEGERV